MTEISKVCQQLVVIFVYKVIPVELRIWFLWPVDEKIVSPNLSWYICLLCLISKNPCASTLWKFASFIVEIFSCWYVMKESPILLSSNQTWWKDYGMKRNIVFSHKLVKINSIRLPPFSIIFPKQISSDRYVTNRSIKPYIEYFFLVSFHWNTHSPF